MKRSDSHTSKRKTDAPPQLMLEGISTFGGPADASDKKTRRRMPRMSNANPDLCPQIMVMQLEGSRMHALDTSEQGQRSGSWSALLSALGPPGRTASQAASDDDTDVTTPPPVGRQRYKHSSSDVHTRYTPTQRSPLSSASSEMSPSPEPLSGHYSDPATYAESPRHSTFKSSLGLVDLRGHGAIPSYLRPHRDAHESAVGQATPLDLSAGLRSSRDPQAGSPPPLWSLHHQSLGVNEAAAYRRDALASLPALRPRAREHVLERAQPDHRFSSSPSLSPPASQSPVLPSNSDSDLSTPASGAKRTFFETVLNPSTREPEEKDDDDVMLVDTDPAPSPRRRSAPASSTASSRGSLSIRTSEYITRTYTVVPATARPPRKERVSDPAVKPFACRHCTRRYRTETERNAHLDKHKYPCDAEGCGAVLTDLSTLKAHKDRHAGVRSYTCDCSWPGRESEPCGKSFVTFGDLYQHMRQTHGVVPKSQGEIIHVGKKPFPNPKL